MSSVYSYSALRFKITKDFENVNEMYKLFRGIWVSLLR